MQDTLNIRLLLREQGDAAHGSAVFNFEQRDFLGFDVEGPVQVSWSAKPSGDAVRLDLTVQATIKAECVRCLNPFTRQETIEKTYDIRLEDLEGEYPEYPATLDGLLDLEEMAYGELVLEVTSVLVCGEDCEGLCAGCGQPAAQCTCEGKAPRDPRWQALWHLLDDE